MLPLHDAAVEGADGDEVLVVFGKAHLGNTGRVPGVSCGNAPEGSGFRVPGLGFRV